MAILPDNEFYTFEDRNYINPQVSLNEQNAFVDNLRNVQKTNNDQINMQTYNLGTAVPSSVGGLTGANSYFSSRYQTPQMNSLAANLRATAQAKALNDVLANEQAKMQKRYNDAYHASQVRSSNQQQKKGGLEYENNEKPKTTEDNGGWVTNKYLPSGASRKVTEYNGYVYAEDTLSDGTKHISYTDDPLYKKGSDGYYHLNKYEPNPVENFLGGVVDWITGQSSQNNVRQNNVGYGGSGR